MTLEPMPGLRLEGDACLRRRNSFGVPSRARLLAVAERVEAVDAAFGIARAEGLPVVLLGGGSNVLLLGDLDALVLVPALRGIEWRESANDCWQVRAAAGEDWHAFVGHTLDRGACGLENLALIPGSVGAAPIQNIGAYGVELARYVGSVEAWDGIARRPLELSAADCAFAYRDSRFKHADQDRLVVCAVRFDLPRKASPQLGYAALREELAARGIADPSPRQIHDAVVAIRQRKLPDPAQLGNAGSFFKNPTLDEAQARDLLRRHPGLPHWPAGPGRSKLAAAWLIEACGWKGYRQGAAGVHAEHALVLVNHGGASGADIWSLARRIQDSVRQRFAIELETEPRIVKGSGC